MEHKDNILLSKCENCGGALQRITSTHYKCVYCHSDFFVAADNDTEVPQAQEQEHSCSLNSRKKRSRRAMTTQHMTLAGLLTAIVVVLQLLGSFIRLGPFSVSLVLIPIVIGAATCGTLVGSWLGLAFGITVLLSGDAASFLAVHVAGTVLTVLVKGVACGFFASIVYRLLEKCNGYVAVVAAAVVCPVVNTGVFLIGCKLFFWETVAMWAEGLGFANATAYAFLGLAGANFLFELGFNIVLSPVIVRLLNIRKKQIS